MENQKQTPNPALGTTTESPVQGSQPVRENRNVSSHEPETKEELAENLSSSEASMERPKPTPT